MPPQPEIETMDQSRSDKPEGAPACARNADAGSPSGGAGPERRFSPQRKLAAVTRLLRGEPLETVARELNLTVARLSEWRDRALVGAEAAMKERERDSRDEELLRLGAKLGEATMTNELLERKIAALEGGRPLARRRGGGGEPCRLASHGPRLRPGPGRPRLALVPRHGLPPSRGGRCRGAAPPAAPRSGRGLLRCRVIGAHPGADPRLAPARRGPPQDLGPPAPCRDPHLGPAGPGADRAAPASRA